MKQARGQNIRIDEKTTTTIPPKERPARGPSTLYTTVAAKALKNPGEWVVIRGYRSGSVASLMRQGRYPAIDPRDHEIEVRKEDDDSYSLYIKYVGKVVEKE